jgi:transcriptional regulator with XRE-family HTH domain
MTDRNREAQERFGANVDALRQSRGMSVEALAERSQLGPEDLAGILNGEAEANANSVYLLAGALGVDPGDLFNGMSWAPPADGGSGHAFDKSKRR